MFRPCKWAIIRLSTELVRRLYNRCGDILGDEISSYIINHGVSIVCQHNNNNNNNPQHHIPRTATNLYASMLQTFNHDHKQKLHNLLNCGLIMTHYNYKCVLVLTTLKMVTCVVETCQWLLCN